MTGFSGEALQARSGNGKPGRVFAEACAAQGLDAVVEYDVTITDSLTSSRRKPRHPVRSALSVVDLSRQGRRYYWHESPGLAADPPVRKAEIRRELAHHFHKSPIPPLFTTTAWVGVPDGLWEDVDAFESFLNYRLIVRLCTAENHTILHGDDSVNDGMNDGVNDGVNDSVNHGGGGLLTAPGIERMTAAREFGSAVFAACDEVEQRGSTVDGMIINPADYYRLMAGGHVIQDLEYNGVFIVRTRLVGPGSAFVGDFGHGAQLFDAGRSVIRFAQAPPGTLAEPGIALKAEIYERAVVNLPTNFFVVTL